MLPRCITNDPWPWLRIPCRKRRQQPHESESLMQSRDVEFLQEALEAAVTDYSPPETPPQISPVIKLSESQRFREELGRRIAMSRDAGHDHARHRWDMAVWQILTQLDVVDTMRRHHR
eukprot:gene8822-7781_t